MLTHEQLNITEPEFKALLTVRNGLDSGLYEHVESIWAKPTTSPRGFNMNIEMNRCGSVGCIGGWMAAEMSRSPQLFVKTGPNSTSSKALHPLFFPNVIEGDAWELLTTEDAVKAIDNFLSTGKPDWESIAIEKGLVDAAT